MSYAMIALANGNVPLCYLATPYSKYPEELGGLEGAFVEAARIAGVMLRAGVSIYSPIVHMHPLAIHGKIDPLDHSIWLPANQAMMNVCDTLIVATMASWQSSYGISHELDWYRKQKRRIFWLDPVTFTMTKETGGQPQMITPPIPTGTPLLNQTNNSTNTLAHDKTPSLHAGTSE